MKNLTKKLLFIMAIFPVFIFSVFTQKAMAQDIPQCNSFGTDLECSRSLDGTSCTNPTKPQICIASNFKLTWGPGDHLCCKVPPTSCSGYTNAGCKACTQNHPPLNCGWNGTSCEEGTSACPAGHTSWFWSSCDSSANICTVTPSVVIPATQVSNPAAAPTPIPTPVSCLDLDPSGVLTFVCTRGSSCDSGWISATQNPNTTCATLGATCCWRTTPTSPSASNLVWKIIASACSVPTVTTTSSACDGHACGTACYSNSYYDKTFKCGATCDTTKEIFVANACKEFSCQDQTGPYAGNYQCRNIVNGSTQCDTGYNSFTTPASYTETSCDSAKKGCCLQGTAPKTNPFQCTDQATGDFAGTYACGSFTNGFAQCPSGFSELTPPTTFTGTSCSSTQRCCKKNPTSTTPNHCTQDSNCTNPASSCQLSPGKCDTNSGICLYPKSAANGAPCQLDNGIAGQCLAGTCIGGNATPSCGGTQGNTSYACQDGCLPGQSTATFYCANNKVCCGTTTVPAATTAPTAVPTATVAPTAVPDTLKFTLAITQNGLVSTPVNPTRQAAITATFDNGQTFTKNVNLNYVAGAWTGTVDTGLVVPAGIKYSLAVTIGSYIRSFFNNFTVTSNQLSLNGFAIAGPTYKVAGPNNIVVSIDAVSFWSNALSCLSTVGGPKCNNPSDVDLNGDGKVDGIDLNTYQYTLANQLNKNINPAIKTGSN